MNRNLPELQQAYYPEAGEPVTDEGNMVVTIDRGKVMHGGGGLAVANTLGGEDSGNLVSLGGEDSGNVISTGGESGGNYFGGDFPVENGKSDENFLG